MKQLPGFYGQLTVDIGEGKSIRIAVWESNEGRTAIFDYPQTKQYGETIEARMDMPIIGRGTVISNTLIQA